MRLRTVTSEIVTSAGDTLERCGWGEAGLMVATSKDGSGSLAWMICAAEETAIPAHVVTASKRRAQFAFEDMLQDTLQ